MPLPANFSSWEHLQTTLMQVQNRIVREEFNDVEDDDNIATPRGSLKVACTLKDSDSAIESLIRLWFFYGVLQKAANFHPNLYTIPVGSYQESVKFKPQIKLCFYEDLADVEKGYDPIEAEISFRLMNDSSENLTPTRAEQIANRVKTLFTTSKGFRWQKGRVKASYRDVEKGYQLILSAYSETEAKRVIEQVLDIQGHTPDWQFLSISKFDQNPPIVPPSKQIYGKTRRTARKRPVGWVRFRHAELHVWGVARGIVLIDRLNKKRGALVKA